MLRRLLTFVAFAAFATPAAAADARVDVCCSRAHAWAAPVPAPIWGFAPAYVVNQGPVFSGPGFYTAPIYEGEESTDRFPYVGSTAFFDTGANADPFRKNLYHPFWPMLRGLRQRLGRYHDSAAR